MDDLESTCTEGDTACSAGEEIDPRHGKSKNKTVHPSAVDGSLISMHTTLDELMMSGIDEEPLINKGVHAALFL